MSNKLSDHKYCRACGGAFYPGNLLEYNNLPRTAQYLPEKEAPDSGTDLNIRQCSCCGLVQHDSEPVPYFREVIRATSVSKEMAEFRRGQFSGWLQKYDLVGKKVLECGCGAGEFMHLMRDSGAVVFGMEYSDSNLDTAKKAGLNVEKGYFEGPSPLLLQQAPFDGFYILNYLEHIPDLKAYLNGIYSALSENAYGLVEVPNFDMILQNNTFAEFMTDHLYYFTRKTLTTLLESNGFDVLNCSEVVYNYVISAEVRKRVKLNLSGFHDARDRMCQKLRRIADQSRCLVVWGASHQAFALLAMADMGGRIRCILDSASFKQGKISPATHIPIVNPDSIPDQTDVLIAMAGGYSMEVARIARKKFGRNIDIWILKENDLVLYEE